MGRFRNKVKNLFSRARSHSRPPEPRLTQQPPALTASAVGPSPSSLTRVPSSNSLPHTAVATAPPVGIVHIGPHVVSSNSHSTSQHFDPKSTSTKVNGGTAGADNTISQTPNVPTSSWNNLVVTPIASLNPLAGDEIFQEQLSKCQNTLTEAQRRAFLGASATSILDMIAELNNQHSKNSITRKYTTKVKGFLQVADNYMNAIGIMIQHSPEFSSLIVGGLRFFIDEAMEKWMRYLGYVSKYAELYSHYEEVKKAICVAYGDLIDFLKCIYELFVGETGTLNNKISGTLLVQQFTKPLETNIAAIMANLNEHITFVEKTTDILEKKRQWLKEKQEAEEEQTQQRRDILAWLSKLEPEKDLERIYAKRHNGTGMWFLNSPEVNEWFQQDKKSLLWCYGTAGVGKSVLA
ncbi:hypothetical protein BDZ91DRAFT_791533 [Kalaharituber pfeilii]|nr:hypothetical protein BDZ91DRAFT_791533 [Kalaharituber pfeilii]